MGFSVDLPHSRGRAIVSYLRSWQPAAHQHIRSKDSVILASSYFPSFVSPDNIPTNSLCKHLKIKTPSYVPTLVPHMHPIESSGVPVGVVILHTPGHTPDELALYDASEKMLYVGDSLYEDAPIIFPKEGSIVDWFASVDSLISFVNTQNTSFRGVSTGEVLINAGHCTVSQPAIKVLEDARSFLSDVVGGKEKIRERSTVRGEATVSYAQQDGKLSLRCPERLVQEAHNYFR